MHQPLVYTTPVLIGFKTDNGICNEAQLTEIEV